MQAQEHFFDVKKYNLDIESFTLRSITGEDEISAEERARSSGTTAAFMEELIAEAIVAVNGERVEVSPYVAWKRWTSRTRDLVRAAFQRINNASQEDLSDFLRDAMAGEVN